jgi:hypothetical protein
VLCAGLLASGLIVLLLLNTAVAQDSFGLQRLQAGSQQLTDQKQALVQNNDLAASPEQLAQRAWALGLVPASGSAFVELPSGRVVGVASPAVRSKPPTVITSNTRTTSTRPAAPAIQAGPLLAPASPVAQTAVSGTAPGLPPAAQVTAQRSTGPTTSTTTSTTTTR